MAGHQDEPLRIVLVGKTGSGKSATANTILGKNAFTSGVQPGSVSKECQTASGACGRRKLLVVDTPGLFDTKEGMSTTCRKISQCVLCSIPGPHAIILVVRLGRQTDEERKTLDLIKAIFGEPAMKHMIFLFTRKDELEGHALSTFIAKADNHLKAIIKECDFRYCAFNNRSADEAENKAQVQELLELIEEMVHENGGAHFSDPIYKYTEKTWKLVEEALSKTSAERDAMIKKVIEQYNRNEISSQEKEKQVASINEKYEKKLNSVKEEGEENVLKSIFKEIFSVLLKVWRRLWN